MTSMDILSLYDGRMINNNVINLQGMVGGGGIRLSDKYESQMTLTLITPKSDMVVVDKEGGIPF